MADKQFPLSIVLRTVDKATAGINAFSKRIDALTKPTRDFGKALSTLGEKSGLGTVMDGFKGVGSAVGDLLGKVAMVGGAVAIAAAGLVALVDHFEALGKVSERLGVEADFLAGMRYAATKTGATVEQLDEGIQTFAQNLGQAKAGTGRMVKFLSNVAPTLLTQLQATTSTQEALGLLADAMEQVTNKSKLLALGQKTLGDSSLAPLFHRGSKGIMELMGSYAKLAGPQQAAVDEALEAGEAMKDLNASMDGVKAAIVVGLAPALKVVVDKLTTWFVAHRGDIATWVADIGEKLPGAVQAVIDKVTSAYDWVTKFVDSIGGLKTVAIAVAAVIAGPLVGAIVSLGIALLTTPVGWFLLAVGAIALGAYLVIRNWNGVGDAFKDLWDIIKPLMTDWEAVWTAINASIDQTVTSLKIAAAAIKLIKGNLSLGGSDDFKAGLARSFTPEGEADARGAFARHFGPPMAIGNAGERRTIDVGTLNGAIGAATNQVTEARVKIDIAGAPRGTRVTADPQNTADVDLSVGYQMAFGI